jgi:hypothetical protein
MLVPLPVGNRETVMLVPFEHLVADDARAVTAHDKIGSARRVAVSLRLFVGPKHLDPVMRNSFELPMDDGF